LNAQHEWWDNLKVRDRRGERIVEWIKERRWSILNDGSVTRQNRVVGGNSTPDVTCCSGDLERICEWQTVGELGSDHKPILIGLDEEAKGSKKSRVVWDWKKAQWEGYQDEIERESARN